MGGLGKAVGSVFGGLAGGMIEGGGLGNSYQAQMPPETMAMLQQALAGQQPIQAQQQQLAQALLAQSQGQGPNPAQMMMKQAGDRANMQGAGMMASSKGLNPAMAARMSGQMTMANQQNVAQQSGIMGAQQQLAAQNQLGSLYGQMGNQNLNQQSVLYNALAGANQVNSGVAAGNAQQRGALTGQLLQGAGAGMGMMMGPKPEAKAQGGFIDGEANVPGDSYSNDVVPAMLSPGEIVVPRTKAKDPELAKEFIEHLFSQKKKKRGA